MGRWNELSNVTCAALKLQASTATATPKPEMRDAACATRMAEDRAQAAAVAVSVSGPRALRDGPACVKLVWVRYWQVQLQLTCSDAVGEQQPQRGRLRGELHDLHQLRPNIGVGEYARATHLGAYPLCISPGV